MGTPRIETQKLYPISHTRPYITVTVEEHPQLFFIDRKYPGISSLVLLPAKGYILEMSMEQMTGRSEYVAKKSPPSCKPIGQLLPA